MEEMETEEREAGGGEEETSPERDGEEKMERGKRENAGEGTKGKEIHHQQMERETMLGDERKGRGGDIAAEKKTVVETETGPETERGIQRGIETAREIEEEKG